MSDLPRQEKLRADHVSKVQLRVTLCEDADKMKYQQEVELKDGGWDDGGRERDE
jgi:hypothetical protein